MILMSNQFMGQSSPVAQPVSKVLPNGVIIHESVGVEGVVTETTETPKYENTVEYWTEDQIRETIEYIKIKRAENCSVQEYNSYQENLKMLEERLNQLEKEKQK